MSYTREALNNMLDTEIDGIYTSKKNDYLKLYRLKNGNYSVYYNGSNIFESHSKRISMIEFILEHNIKKIANEGYNLDNFFEGMFGFKTK